MPRLKIAFHSYSPHDHLDGWGGLEQRFSVSWAYFLREEGHDVHFLPALTGCDSSFDLYWDAPVRSEAGMQCGNIHAKKHLHNYFAPDVRGVLSSCPCSLRGECYFSSPYVDKFRMMQGFEQASGGFKAVFTPIAYPDNWKPQNLIPGFDRTEIMWCNKGSLDPQYGPESRAPYYPTNSVAILKALVKLNQKVDFKMTFVLDSLIRTARPEYGTEALIAQLRNVERLDVIPWTNLIERMSKCKINTHAGGLTSAINECLFVEAVPLAPPHFGFFTEVCQHFKIIPDPQTATADEIYEGLERLWFDRDWYNQISAAFQEPFGHNRTEGLRKAFKELLEILY